ncbi:MAG TPA: hypothetical protein VF649_01655 [Sphingomonas sp.]|jgi:hypothetical protein|uniref:hypothetical protein n=1 Tax=Sphingomonas sp. TaxID=28214 RepID=UPI002EDA8901
MARSPKLKVFRTAIGFHDAYVAASSKKAALAAWGSESDLFAWNAAEVVTDPALTEAPLAQPGTVIKRPRGTSADHLAALPPDPPKADRPKPGRSRAAPRPRPDRAALTEADRAVSDAEAQHAADLRQLRDREAALARERRALERAHTAKMARLEQDRDRARAAYEDAMAAWRG